MALSLANTIVASTDAADVTGCRTLFVDSTAASVVLGGLSGGVEGQLLTIVKNVATNDLTVEHAQSAGTQKFYFDSAANQVMTAVKGGMTFVFDGTDWVCVGCLIDAVT